MPSLFVFCLGIFNGGYELTNTSLPLSGSLVLRSSQLSIQDIESVTIPVLYAKRQQSVMLQPLFLRFIGYNMIENVSIKLIHTGYLIFFDDVMIR